MTRRIHAERISACSICRNMEDYECVDYIREPDAKLPPEARQLVAIKTLGYAYPELMRCPICGTYYLYNVDCGYMEHDVSYERITDEAALARLDPPKTGR